MMSTRPGRCGMIVAAVALAACETVYTVDPGSYTFKGGISTLSQDVAPQITGTAQVGQKLTADAGSWTPEPSTVAYQWLRNGNPIPGATGSSYQLVAADQGASLKVVVTVSARGLADATATSQAVTIGAGTLLPTALPTIEGKPKVGSRLTAVAGGWPAGTALAYQWNRAGRAISGATTSVQLSCRRQRRFTFRVGVLTARSSYPRACAVTVTLRR